MTMMFKKLRPLSEEYYYLLMAPEMNKTSSLSHIKKLYWGLYYLTLMFSGMALFIASTELYPPFFISIISYIVSAIVLLYGIALIITTLGKTLFRYYRVRIYIQCAGGIVLQLALWNCLLNLFCIANGGAVQYLILFLFVLLFGTGFNIWILYRGARQILKGALKKDGEGFWGVRNKPLFKKLGHIALLVTPAISSLGTGLIIWAISSHRLVEFTRKLSGSPHTATPPFESEILFPVIAALLLLIVLALCSAFSYGTFTMSHLYHKFEWKVPTVDHAPKKQKGGVHDES